MIEKTFNEIIIHGKLINVDRGYPSKTFSLPKNLSTSSTFVTLPVNYATHKFL